VVYMRRGAEGSDMGMTWAETPEEKIVRERAEKSNQNDKSRVYEL